VVQTKQIRQVQQILLIQLNNKGINKMISLVLTALVACSTEEAPKAESTTAPVVEVAIAAAQTATATTEVIVVPATEATPAPATSATPATTTGASK
jgi:hypothetical protein